MRISNWDENRPIRRFGGCMRAKVISSSLLTAILGLFLVFQNCSQVNLFKSLEPKTEASQSPGLPASGSGNGTGYGGKPTTFFALDPAVSCLNEAGISTHVSAAIEARSDGSLWMWTSCRRDRDPVMVNSGDIHWNELAENVLIHTGLNKRFEQAEKIPEATSTLEFTNGYCLLDEGYQNLDPATVSAGEVVLGVLLLKSLAKYELGKVKEVEEHGELNYYHELNGDRANPLSLAFYDLFHNISPSSSAQYPEEIVFDKNQEFRLDLFSPSLGKGSWRRGYLNTKGNGTYIHGAGARCLVEDPQKYVDI